MNIETLEIQLAAAQKDAALWERLSAASDLAARLSVDLEQAKAEAESARAAQAVADKAAQFGRISNLRVTRGGVHSDEESLLRRAWDITWTETSYSSETRKSEPIAKQTRGFGGLAPHVLQFLIERHPEEIPPAIAALAPGDPQRAFDVYFQGQRRGYLSGVPAE